MAIVIKSESSTPTEGEVGAGRAIAAMLGGGAAAFASEQAIAQATIGAALRDLYPRMGPSLTLPRTVSQATWLSAKERDALKQMAKERKVQMGYRIHKALGSSSGNYYMDPTTPLTKRVIKSLPKKARKTFPKKPIINLSHKPVAIALHELGHAKPILGSKLTRQVWHDGVLLSRGPGRLAKTVGLAAVLAGKPAEGTMAAGLYDHAPAIAAAAEAPLLAEEARASINAMRDSRRAGQRLGKTLRLLAPAYATYAGAAASRIGALIIAKKVVEAIRGDGGPAEKTARAANPEVRARGLLRAQASRAWQVGGTPPKPKSNKPKPGIGRSPSTRTKAKPPSNLAYHRDTLPSLHIPQRGNRLSVA